MRTLITTTCALLLTAAAPASAGPEIDGIFEGTADLNDEMEDLGAGVGARVGYNLGLGPVDVRPEAGLTWYGGANLFVPQVGARARIGALIQPGVYGHVLLPLPTSDGPTTGWDAGALVDFTALPVVDAGVHAGLVTFGGPALEDPQRSLTFGLHVGAAL